MPVDDRNSVSNSRKRPRLLLAVTSHLSAGLLRGQISYFNRAGWDVAILASDGPVARTLSQREGAEYYPVPIRRNIAPFRDLIALVQIVRALRDFQPDVVNAGTPKAGLLVMLASWLSRVPRRIYTLRGLRLETTSGVTRQLLKALEKVSCRTADRVLCISPSLRDRAVELGLVPIEKTVVVGYGSSNGIDLERFSRTEKVLSEAQHIRKALGVPEESRVIGFVGRFVRDKGISELWEAWQSLRESEHDVILMIVGPIEPDTPDIANILHNMNQDERIRIVGKVPNPAPYFACMSLCVLPTYREGFGNVLIEAAAMGLPVVSTRVTGCVDAVEDGVTGTLVPPGSAAALHDAVFNYLRDGELRAQHGSAGRKRVEAHFRRERIWRGINQVYEDLLNHVGMVRLPG